MNRLVFLLGAFLSAAAAGQQGFVDQANNLYRGIEPSRDSSRSLLAALAKLDDAPLGADSLERVRLASPGSRIWPVFSDWAAAEPQQQALAALREVTPDRPYINAPAFAQPYGPTGIDIPLLRAGIYTDLGDPPLLAGAEFGYLDALQTLRSLVHIEATRLTTSGQVIEAADLLFRLTILGRQMVDRAFMTEAYWGYTVMIDAMSRIRDVVYMDFIGDRTVEPNRLREIIASLDADGGLALDRLKFPVADRIASEQLRSIVYEERGGVRADAFVQNMSRLGSAGRPLRRFASSAVWNEAAETQVDWFDIADAIEKAHSGWTRRWILDPDSPVLKLPYPYWDYAAIAKYAIVTIPMLPSRPEGGPLRGEVLFRFRTTLEAERVGTRLALAVVGRYYEQNRFPRQLAGVRPRWIDEIEVDAFSAPDLTTRERDVMKFFVPVRDDYVQGVRDEAEPHQIEVFPGTGENFAVELYDDQFVLYSVGANAEDDRAIRVSLDPEVAVGDYLIWPPVLGLYRTHRQEIGELD
ncbi:MAG: hypothetical protein AAF235_02690 [Planctomycetota bacterium]